MQASRSTALARTLRGVCRTPATHTAAARHLSSSRAAIPATATSLLRRLTATQQHHQPSQPPTQTRHASSSSSTAALNKTPLHDLHLAHGAKMVPFGGFHMPVQYASQGVVPSHLFTRAHASLFDVGHMVQRVFSGPGAAAFLERLTPSAVGALAEHRSSLTCLMSPEGTGGIVDDAIVTRLPGGRYYVVTNAACREKDDGYFEAELGKWDGEAVTQEILEGRGLVALQGPDAAGVLAQVLEGGLELKKLLFGQSAYAKVRLGGNGEVSSDLLISRGGYTGEDGFEISIPAEETVAVTEALLAAGGPDKVRLAGLGARDTLRLEAGMCLYGHDLDESTSPVMAGLAWIIPKARRTADAGYYGADVIAKQLQPESLGPGHGVERRRVGLVVEGAPAREGAEVVAHLDSGEVQKVGRVTSGSPSPSLGNKYIAMAYVKPGYHKSGTVLDVLIRGKQREAVVTKMPFVPTKYWKGEA